MEIYITDESVYKPCWASHHPANLLRNPYKLFIGVYCSQIASPNYKYLNINERGSLELMQWAIPIKLQIGRKTQFYFHWMLIFFFYFIINKTCSYKWQQIPTWGRERGVKYWPSQMSSFSEAYPLRYLWKCKTVNEIFFFLIDLVSW